MDLSNSVSLLSMAMKGGWLMLVLLIISIISIAIIIERMLKIKRATSSDNQLFKEVSELLKANQTTEALNLCNNAPNNPLNVILAKGVEAFSVSIDEVEKVIASTAKNELHKLEKNLGTLASFSAIGPLIGFLGTVTGMVKVFMKIEQMGGGVDISFLAQGIWEAMLTTVGGLIVGIITILFYNYLVGKLEAYANELEENANQFMLDIRRENNGTQSK